MKKMLPLTVAGLSLLFAGCGPKEETGAGLKPAIKLEGKSLDEQIATIQNDKMIPPEYKETEITALKAKAAAAKDGGAKSGQ